MRSRASKRLRGAVLAARTGPTRWRLRFATMLTPSRRPGVLTADGLRISYPDLLEASVGYDHIFRRRIYDFDAGRPDPRVLDAGGHIGLVTLYTKRRWPAARVTVFEPDPVLGRHLANNLAAAGIDDVEVVEAAVAARAGRVGFKATGGDDGRLDPDGTGTVRAVTLSSYLDDEVDFLKLNVEGAELDVLTEAGPRLRRVREMVIEYHGWAGEPQRLGPILEILDAQGFRYVVNHLDYLSNPAARPPFELGRDTSWWALIYARRGDLL